MQGINIEELVEYLVEDDPVARGTAGEFLAYMEMTDLTATRRILRNIYVPHWKGDTTEIDLLLIHATGFYVVESKNFSGWIYGDEDESFWEAHYPAKGGGRDIYDVDNPIGQNKTHADALRQYISFYGELPVHSIVAYGDWCTLKCVHRTTEETLQCHYRGLHRLLRGMTTQGAAILSTGEVNMFYRLLLPLVDKDRDTHVERLRGNKRNDKG